MSGPIIRHFDTDDVPVLFEVIKRSAMLSDVLLIGEKHKSAAKEIACHVFAQREPLVRTSPGYRYVIAVSGESGAGKSELSHSLARELKKNGIRVKILHADNYYRIKPMERRVQREATNFKSVGINEYDWALLNRNIDDFKQARASTMPCIDILTDEIDQLSTDFSCIDVLVVDGLYAVRIESVDLRVFIDLSYHETKKSQLERGKELTDDHRWQVLEREHRSVQSLRYLADLVVDRSFLVVNAASYDADGLTYALTSG